MGVVLFFVANFSNLMYGYLFASLTLDLLGKSATPARRLLFALFTCVIFQSLLIYGPYVFARIQWHTALRPFLATPNPLYVFLFYYFGVRVLNLSRYRLVHFLTLLYLFCLFSVCLSRVFKYTLFTHVLTTQPYNYLLDVMSTIVGALTHLTAYFILRSLIRWKNYGVRFSDSLVTKSLPRALWRSFLAACFAYGIAVFTEIWCPEDVHCLFWLCIFITLAIVVGIYRNMIRVGRMAIQNNDAHINALSEAIDQFRGVKHDFYNVLGTYSAYISLGSIEKLRGYHEKLMSSTLSAGEQLEIVQKMEQNPTLVTLILQKKEYADIHDVYYQVLIRGDIQNLYIDELDQCRVMANLLDNAIEAAADSTEKRVNLLIETKWNQNILIALTNTFSGEVDLGQLAVPGFTSKEGHSGLGIVQVRRILNQYPNCSIQFRTSGNTFTAYLEILPPRQ